MIDPAFPPLVSNPDQSQFPIVVRQKWTERKCNSYTCARSTSTVHCNPVSTVIGRQGGSTRAEVDILRQSRKTPANIKLKQTRTEIVTPLPGVPILEG